MDRIYEANVSVVPPTPPSPGSFGWVQSDVPSPSFEPTEPGVWAFHYITESFRNVVVGAGMTPDGLSLGQLAAAVKLMADSAPPPPPPTSSTLYVYNFDTDTSAAFAVSGFPTTTVATDSTRLRTTAQAQFGAGSFQMGTPTAAVSPLALASMTAAGKTTRQATLEFSTNRFSFGAGWIGQFIVINPGTASELTIFMQTDFPPNYGVQVKTPTRSNVIGTVNVSTDTWTQWAITFDMDANVMNVFMNGTLITEGGNPLWGDSGIWPTISAAAAMPFDVALGAMDVTGHPDQVGYVDEIRLSSSVLYTADYTPVTSAFPLA